MANPFQQQVRQRKILYIGLIVVLFTLAFLGRTYAINPKAAELSLREEDRGEVELVGAVVRLGLTGVSRGLATCVLWYTAIDKQKKNQWNELEVLARVLTKLQPHFITPWLFQSWNLSYNVSVEADRVRDKYFYITRGLELLAQGERQNKYQPDLRWSIGFYGQHKICLSDETNYLRSLFQLSIVPPNERDPARFYLPDGEINWAEAEKFCKEWPQLVRRLHVGMHRENLREKKRLFTCETFPDIVQFLEENYQVPSLYVVPPLPPLFVSSTKEDPNARIRRWDASKKDQLLNVEARFPVLPPQRDGMYDPESITDASPLRDSTDMYTCAQAWFAYSQEALPRPGELPGSSEPIDLNERTRLRRPRNMTTLIFRNYPAQGRRYMAERLQQEGWFLDEGWDCKNLFSDSRTLVVGGGEKWSLDAWKRAFRAWERHGQENKLLFGDIAEEERTRQEAERFAKKYRMQPNGMPPELNPDELSPEEQREYRAARVMFEYNFYRQLSNFAHHYNRCEVEQKPETIACRLLFYLADQANLAGSPLRTLDIYSRPVTTDQIKEQYNATVESDAWKAKAYSPLQAWRDLVLLKNKAFRRDSFAEELSAEVQIRYLQLYNRAEGLKLKEQLVRAAPGLPLTPKFVPSEFTAPIIQGPFAGTDDEGVPLIGEGSMRTVLDRMGLVSPKPQAPGSSSGQPTANPTPTPEPPTAK